MKSPLKKARQRRKPINKSDCIYDQKQINSYIYE
jgi:hypothetical protein